MTLHALTASPEIRRQGPLMELSDLLFWLLIPVALAGGYFTSVAVHELGHALCIAATIPDEPTRLKFKRRYSEPLAAAVGMVTDAVPLFMP